MSVNEITAMICKIYTDARLRTGPLSKVVLSNSEKAEIEKLEGLLCRK